MISKDISSKILFLGVSMKTKGGMAAVLVSYNQYIEQMRFIPTWRLGNKLVKSWYALQAWVRTWWLCHFNRELKIVHIHGAANASFQRCRMFIRLAKKCGKKVILHEHAADFVEFYNNSKDKEGIVSTINMCDCLIALSKSWKNYFTSIGVEGYKIHVLNNIVSPPATEGKHPDDEKLHLMYMGEISNRKGAFDLLKALADNKDYFNGKLFVRMGGNEVDGDIKTYIRDNGLSDFVSFEGWISRNAKVDCMVWQDVYILPSYNEGLPIAILEAMSYRHPIISTPVGGIPEVVEHGINGLLVQPGRVDEIADAIKYFINNRHVVDEWGAASYEKVKEFFPDAVFSNLKRIYETI